MIAVTGDRTGSPSSTATSSEALAKPAGRAEFGMCGTAEPGTPAFTRVLCREDHTWQAISVIDLADTAKDGGYPGEKRSGTPARTPAPTPPARSPRTRSTTSGATSGPPKDQWQAGQTYGRCWASATLT